MNDELTSLELELGEGDGYGDWEMQDFEDLEDWEVKTRRPLRRPGARPAGPRLGPGPMGRPYPPAGRPGGRPYPPAGRPGRRPHRHPGARPYPYPGYGPVQTLPPIVVRVRPAMVLDRFRFSQPNVRQHHIPLIKQMARRIVASWRTSRPIRVIRLVGHTDSAGDDQYNEGLGSRRSRAVGTVLIREINRLHPGLTRRMRIIAQTLGESRPVASNRTAQGRARNRRVQIYVSRD